MSEPRTPRSKPYDGALYGRLVDPLLAGVHGFVSERLPAGGRILDACCGTGALARRLAGDGDKTVLGVDLSPRNIAYAEAKRSQAGLENLSFEVGDVATLEADPRSAFDVATIVLALHEMPRRFRLPVLRRLASLATRVMCVDYAVPMPWNRAGLRNRAIEMAAGCEHFRAFLDWNRQGGLPPLVEAAGLRVEAERTLDRRTLVVQVLRREGSR